MKCLTICIVLSACMFSCNYREQVKVIKGHWIILTQDDYYEVYSRSDGSYYLFDGVTGDYIEENENKLSFHNRPFENSITSEEMQVIRTRIFQNLLGINDSMKFEDLTYNPQLSFENFKVESNQRFKFWLIKYKSSEDVGDIEKDIEMKLN